MTPLKEYKKATHKLANYWVNWFYADGIKAGDIPKETMAETKERFVSADILYDIMEIAGMFVDIHDITECIQAQATPEQFMGWYWSADDNYNRKYNLKHWVKLK